MSNEKIVKKGGTRFPNYSLKDVTPNLKDLLSKTHTKPITIEQLNAGVFKVRPASQNGKVRYSSLKQFRLATGEYAAITSTQLAQDIVNSSGKEKIQHLRSAFLNVATFRNAFETFQDSSVTRDRIKGYASGTLKVHPDLTDKFLESFLASAKEAELCSLSGDEITFSHGKDIHALEQSADAQEQLSEEIDDVLVDDNLDDTDDKTGGEITETGKGRTVTNGGAPNIDIKIDPSLDADKLEKQLKVLRKFGLI